MRVLLVHAHVGLPEKAGGSRHYSLARELVERGHRVTILTSSFSHMTKTESLQPGERLRRAEIDGIDFVWLRTPPYTGNTVARLWNMLSFARSVWRLRRSPLLQEPEVIMGSSPHPFGALAAERLARSLGVPYVLEVRDLWPQTLLDLGRISARHPLITVLGAVERHLYRRANQIITLLPGAEQHMIAKGANPDRITWIPNGVNPELIPGDPPIDRAATSEDTASLAPQEVAARRAPFTVLYTGSHGLSNQLDTVLDAAKLLMAEGWTDRMRIRLIGDGPAKAHLMRRATLEGIEMVSFEEPVPKRAVFQLLREADAFIQSTQDTPLYRWGLSPNKLFEYLAAARPVILGCNSPYAPVTEAGAGLTIPPADPRAMADGLRQIAEMPLAERIAMGQRGRAYAIAHHGFRILGARLEQTLATALADGQRAAANRSTGVIS